LKIDRRKFLRALGAGASAAALPPSTDLSGTSLFGTSPFGTSDTVDPPNWAALRAKLRGGLVLPGDSGYDLARRAYNPLFDTHRPAAIARCGRPSDVQACVEFARRARIPIAARSGGHSYAGYSTPNGGLVVDLAGMAGVQVRADRTAVVGAGARLIDVYAGLARAGRCVPAGSCATVGVAGLTLGGGIGVLTRKYGLTSDKLVSAQIVTADGRLLTVSPAAEPDLFWALRGGGGGNFGIVTSFTFATEPAPALTVFSLRAFPRSSAAAVVDAWQDWVAAAPPELWSNCIVSAGSPPGARVGGCFVGAPAALNRLIDKLVARAGARPATRFVSARSYLDAMRYFAGCSTRPVARCRLQEEGGALRREAFVAASGMLLRPLGDPAGLVALLNRRGGIDLLLDSLGGAVRGLGPAATAFPYRTALASAQVYAGTTAATRQRTATAVAEVRAGLQRLAGAAAYVNYIDPRQPGWGTAYYDGNLARLRDVAERYDPDKVFAFAQGIANA
jgi:FAD/FMN-containing dehydrogenase